jgi:hypothetical protein
MDGSIVPKGSFAPSLQTYVRESTNNNTKCTYNTTTNEEEIRALFDRWNDALLEGDPGAVADLYYNNKNHDEQGNHHGTSNGHEEKKKKSHQSSTLLLLLPTLSNEPRTNRASVEEYFVAFLQRKPRGRIVSGQILIGPDGSWAHDAGIYEFFLQQQVPPPPSSTDKTHFGGASSSSSTITNETKHNGGEAARASNHENTNRTAAASTAAAAASTAAAAALGNDSPEKVQESKTSVVRARYSFLYLRDERGEWKIAHHHSSLMPEGD